MSFTLFRTLAAFIIGGGLCYLLGFMHGADNMRYRQFRSLVEELRVRAEDDDW